LIPLELHNTYSLLSEVDIKDAASGYYLGYKNLAEYHKDIDTVVIQFINTTDFDGYEWDLSQIFYSCILKTLRN
jgi:hypothetical protein